MPNYVVKKRSGRLGIQQAGFCRLALGSVLSTSGFAAIRSVGFEPVGQVFGAAVYPQYSTAGFSCPGVVGRDLRLGASPQAPGMGVTTVSGQGVPGPVRQIAQALYDGRRTAIDRMTAECSDLGGHGVVGAVVQVREIPGEVLMTAAIEFTVIGTAMRAKGCLSLDRPFTLDLSGQDFAKTVMAGRRQALRRYWGPGTTPIPFLIRTMEAQGLIITLIPFAGLARATVDAFSTSQLPRPIVVLTPRSRQ